MLFTCNQREDFFPFYLLLLSLFLQIFVDKAAKRAVLSLGVKCVNWKRKCDWTGDLIYVEVSGLHTSWLYPLCLLFLHEAWSNYILPKYCQYALNLPVLFSVALENRSDQTRFAFFIMICLQAKQMLGVRNHVTNDLSSFSFRFSLLFFVSIIACLNNVSKKWTHRCD